MRKICWYGQKTLTSQTMTKLSHTIRASMHRNSFNTLEILD